jgi:hypothetical protein
MRPIILIPGVNGSILVDKRTPYKHVLHHKIPYNRWINTDVLSTNNGSLQWATDMKCSIHKSSHGKVIGLSYDNQDIIPYDMGGTRGIKDIIPELVHIPDYCRDLLDEWCNFRYYNSICHKLYDYSFVDNESVYGIPYDFRAILDPTTRQHVFANFQYYIEKAFRTMGRPAIIVTHSLGGILFKIFCSSCVDKKWLNKYISQWICINAPFGGSLYGMTSVLGGSNSPLLPKVVNSELKYVTGIIACMPNRLGYAIDEPLMYVGKHKTPITIQDYTTFASNDDLISFKIWKDLYEPLIPYLAKELDIPTHMIISKNIKTKILPTLKSYDDNYPIYSGNTVGDGVATMKSLKSYEKFLNPERVRETILCNNNHSSILADKHVIRIIMDYALQHWE